MKTLELCSNCGNYELVDFEYDPGRGGVPRLFGYVNDNVIDMDYDSDDEKHRFSLYGVYCSKCNTLDDTFYWKVDNYFNGTETGKVLTKRDAKLVDINKRLVSVLKEGNKEEKQRFIESLSRNMVDVIKQFDVSDVYSKLKCIEDMTKNIVKYENEEILDEFLKWAKKLIEGIVLDDDNQTIFKYDEEE